MDEKEAQMFYKLKLDQLTMTAIYEEEFLKQLGKKGLNDLRDTFLDEMIKLRKILRK
jgi:hypothetical protein